MTFVLTVFDGLCQTVYVLEAGECTVICLRAFDNYSVLRIWNQRKLNSRKSDSLRDRSGLSSKRSLASEVLCVAYKRIFYSTSLARERNRHGVKCRNGSEHLDFFY